jgi:PhnB protein
MTKSIDALHPYLHFGGNCGEAIEFYRKAIGAEVVMRMSYKDAPPDAMAHCPIPDPANKVMHARLRIGDANLMLSDGPGATSFSGFSLSLSAPNPAEAEKLYKALGEGGKVTMPLGKTFFSPAFGMVTDRFGVPWMVYVEGGPPQ